MQHLPTTIALIAFAVSAISGATPQAANDTVRLDADQPIRLADNNVRKQPKDKKPEKQEPPALPPSSIPGATNPVENKPTPPAGGKDKKPPTVNLPKTGPDHCDGSPNCSKQFDGGKKRS